MNVMGGGLAAAKTEEFRAFISSMCLDKKTSIRKLITRALSKQLNTDADSNKKMLDVRIYRWYVS